MQTGSKTIRWSAALAVTAALAAPALGGERALFKAPLPVEPEKAWMSLETDRSTPLFLKLEQARTGRLIVTARGEVDAGGWPALRLILNGSARNPCPIQSYLWRTYVFPIDLEPGLHEIELARDAAGGGALHIRQVGWAAASGRWLTREEVEADRRARREAGRREEEARHLRRLRTRGLRVSAVGEKGAPIAGADIGIRTETPGFLFGLELDGRLLTASDPPVQNRAAAVLSRAAAESSALGPGPAAEWAWLRPGGARSRMAVVERFASWCAALGRGLFYPRLIPLDSDRWPRAVRDADPGLLESWIVHHIAGTADRVGGGADVHVELFTVESFENDLTERLGDGVLEAVVRTAHREMPDAQLWIGLPEKAGPSGADRLIRQCERWKEQGSPLAGVAWHIRPGSAALRESGARLRALFRATSLPVLGILHLSAEPSADEWTAVTGWFDAVYALPNAAGIVVRPQTGDDPASFEISEDTWSRLRDLRGRLLGDGMSARTDATGTASLRLPLGVHRVTARARNLAGRGTVTLQPGRAHEFRLIKLTSAPLETNSPAPMPDIPFLGAGGEASAGPESPATNDLFRSVPR
jgi:hypothetical protein